MSASDRDARIDAAIAEYLESAPDPAAWLARHDDLRPELESFLADRAAFARAAEPVGPLTVGFDEDPAADVPLGVVRYFGDYELLEEVARGGMGVVYRARQVSLNRVVALKMILRGTLATAEDVRRFRAEAEAAALLDHPNIVPIYEVGEHDGQQYFTMKYVDGGTLVQRFATLRSSATDRPLLHGVANQMAVIARAVHYAHERGILHRDLKPANVLLDAAGTPLVTDFGLAKRVAADATATQSGMAVGTPAYMAPEQARAERQLTTAADVWSLGAILYEALTGRPPFKADTLAATLRLVEDADPPRPRSVNPTVDRDLETVVLRCLEKEPAKRYASAAALADDLDRWQRGEPVLARRVTGWERGWKWAKRRPAVAGLLAACVVLLLAGTTVSWVLTLDARRARDETRERAREARRLLNTLALEQGWQIEQDGDVFRALLWYAEPLNDPDLDPAEEEIVRRRLGMYLRHSLWHQPRRGFGLDEAFLAPVDFSPDGRLLACTTSHREGDILRGSCEIFDTTSGRRAVPSLRHSSGLEAVRFSPDGRLLAIAAGLQNLVPISKHTIQLWDVATGRPVGEPVTCAERVYDLVFSPDGRLLVPALGELDTDSTAQPKDEWGRRQAAGFDLPVFRVDGGLRLATPLRHRGAGCVRLVAFGPDGRRLLTVGDGWWVDHKTRASTRVHWRARVWDLAADGAARETVKLTDDPGGAPRHHATHAGFAADGRHVMVADGDSARVWDLEARSEPVTRLGHNDELRAAAFGPDGRTVVTAGNDRTVRLWDPQTDRQIGPTIRTKTPATWVGLGPGSKTVWTAGQGAFRVWDAATARPLTPEMVGQRVANEAEFRMSPRADTVLLHGGALDLVRLDAVDRRPREDLLLLVRLISGTTLRDGRPEPLADDECRAGWGRLRARYPDVITVPVEACVAWYAPGADAAGRDEHVALFAANQEVAEYPERADGYVFRGEIHLAMNKPDRAAADFERACDLGGRAWVSNALSGYFATRWDDVRTPQPDLDVADRAVAAAELVQRFAPSDLNALHLGAARYRAGRFAAAVETLSTLVAARRDPIPGALAFLAMAHHRLGQAEQARARLAELRAAAAAGDRELTAEAEALIGGRAK